MTDETNADEPEGLMIGYARVSTEDQDLTLQIDALVKAGVEPARIYKETASGADDNRPAFVAAFKAVRPGDTLVVWKLDRLGRRLGRLIHTVDALKAKNVKLRVLTEMINTETAAGILMFQMLGAFAEFERNQGIERTKAGLAAARARGRVGGRTSTITADIVERARKMVADEAEGGQGMSVRDAAKALGISASGLYGAFRKLEEQEDARDLAN